MWFSRREWMSGGGGKEVISAESRREGAPKVRRSDHRGRTECAPTHSQRFAPKMRRITNKIHSCIGRECKLEQMKRTSIFWATEDLESGKVRCEGSRIELKACSTSIAQILWAPKILIVFLFLFSSCSYNTRFHLLPLCHHLLLACSCCVQLPSPILSSHSLTLLPWLDPETSIFYTSSYIFNSHLLLVLLTAWTVDCVSENLISHCCGLLLLL